MPNPCLNSSVYSDLVGLRLTNVSLGVDQGAARWRLWKAHIDTGPPVTVAGSRLARDLLEQHIKHTGHPPPYERLRSATGHPLTVAPVDALVRVPLSTPISARSESPPTTTASRAMGMCVYAGIEAVQAAEESKGRTITLKNWGDCDVLVGMDLSPTPHRRRLR